MKDQHIDRKLTKPEYMEDIEEEIPTTITTISTNDNDPLYIPHQSDLDVAENEVADTAEVPEASVRKVHRHYTLKCLNHPGTASTLHNNKNYIFEKKIMQL